ncbi:hypothetical protein [Pelagibius marinus]|uniref:hypothetical protein n=1 Tax=Pelagibius marinus TaxID=2762760 RepID=UPI0018722F8C|nr:hypothetical protein [Pelagibius marinus]
MALWATALSFWLAVGPAQAGVSGELCHVYNEHDSDVPPEIREIFAQNPNIPVRACALPGDWANATYRLILPPFRGDLGVCQYVTSPVVRENGAWTYRPSSDRLTVQRDTVRMMASEEECPSYTDRRYVVTNDISEGLFMAAMRFWERMSSGDTVDASIASSEVQSTPGFKTLMAALETDRQKQHSWKPASISRFAPDPIREPIHYSIQVNVSKQGWLLIVDFIDGDLRLLEVHSIIY